MHSTRKVRAREGIPCGNGVLDTEEECDAGQDSLKNQDKCCNRTCHLKESAQCRGQCINGRCITTYCKELGEKDNRRYRACMCDHDAETMKTNLVMTVVFLTALFWIPISWCISCMDRKEKKQAPKKPMYVVLHKVIAMENRKLQVEENNVHKKLFHYETLKKSDISLHVRHHRDVDTGHVTARTYVTFFTLGMNFSMVLKAGSPVVSPGLRAYTVDRNGKYEPLHVDSNDFLTGHLQENESMHVYAHYEEDVLCTTVYFPNEIYFTEPTTVFRRVSFKRRAASEIRIRQKRQNNGFKKRCSLRLVADYSFYSQYARSSASEAIKIMVLVHTEYSTGPSRGPFSYNYEVDHWNTSDKLYTYSLQHLRADIEAAESPQKVQPLLGLFVHLVHVITKGEPPVDHCTKVPEHSSSLHLLSLDLDWFGERGCAISFLVCSSKGHLLRFFNVQLQKAAVKPLLQFPHAGQPWFVIRIAADLLGKDDRLFTEGDVRGDCVCQTVQAGSTASEEQIPVSALEAVSEQLSCFKCLGPNTEVRNQGSIEP
ncbi:hypothetical protein C0Q70_00621 [Pomacea canaliculata]|uniref:Disintegrin domain-containing protein n=1 Tax=Pomacea canaliculata TaxID=400727 RepID=A0A2T7PX59_POMCA|nr:hypothetical protein C0Q70_00621 [Pomacea canaliculata]